MLVIRCEWKAGVGNKCRIFVHSCNVININLLILKTCHFHGGCVVLRGTVI